MSEFAVRATGVTLNFGGITALSDVDLEVEPGTLHALLGPNGAGKTSLLNCISGFYTPTTGIVEVHGEDVTGVRSHRMANRGVARTFQNVDLFGQMPVVDNLLLGRHRHVRESVLAAALRLGHVRREESDHRRRAEEIIEFLELEGCRDALLANLPHGVQKLVGVGVALASDPSIILLDEPASGTTREEKQDLARFLLRIKHELGITMLWVEHDVKMVGDLADRVTVLDFGVCIADGPPGRVLVDPRVVSAYLGEAGTSMRE